MKQKSSSDQASIIRVMFGGDVMLGRNVKECILRYGPDYPLGPITPLMRGADLTVVNLECAITSSDQRWPGAAKAYYFGAPLSAVESLSSAGIDLMSLANNHALDYGVDGLRDTLQQLSHNGIRWAGAGEDETEAAAPAIIDCAGISVGMAAFCDHQADFAAHPSIPGIAYLDLADEAVAIAALRRALEPLQHAAVDWPILSLHWGPNMVLRPSAKFRRIAHAAIGMGWKVLFGHSAHVFQGIEFFDGCPILYAAGDLVDDYYVDPEFCNDHQLLFEMELTRGELRRLILYPIFIDRCRTRTATGAEAQPIVERMTGLCAELGTPVQTDGQRMWINAGP